MATPLVSPAHLEALTARLEVALSLSQPQAAPAPVHTLADLIAYCREETLPQKAPLTQYQLHWLYQFLLRELGCALDLRAITPAFLRTWRDQLLTRYAPGTVRRYLDVLSGLLTVACHDLEWIPEQPVRKIRKPPESSGRGRVLTADERDRLLRACRASTCAALSTAVLVALHTGCRKTEIRCLLWEEVDLEQGCLRLTQTKNHDVRIVPLVGQAHAVMQARAAERVPGVPWCFPDAAGTGALYLDYWWEQAVAAAGLEGFRFHDLRHSAATYLVMSGCSLVEVAHILGHRTMRMVQKYAHLTQAHSTDIAARMAEKFLNSPNDGRNQP